MNASEYISNVQSRAEQDGFTWERRDNDGATFYVAKKSKFKPLLAFTKLYFTLTAQAAEHVNAEQAPAFSAEAIERAKKEHEGLPTGLQSGIVSIAVLVSESVDDDVKEVLAQRPQHHLAAFEMPAVYDLKKQELCYYANIPIWGWMMQPTVRRTTRQLLLAS